MSVNPSFLIFDSSACLGMICYRVSTEKLPPTSYSRSQDRWRQPCVFSAPRCSALEGVQAGYRRTTQGPIKNTCRNRNIMSRTIEVDFLRSPVELWQRLLGRPASESGRLRHRDGGHEEGDDRRWRGLMLAILWNTGRRQCRSVESR